MEMKEKIPVAILGATGMVGQKFVELLTNHPWFEITVLAASERSSGKRYGDVVNWQMNAPLPQTIADRIVRGCQPRGECKIAFSGLDSAVAGDIEHEFANAGVVIISNSKNHRMHPHIPLMIPEVNPDHLKMIKQQVYTNDGCIVTNPNCSVVGLAMALKPLADRWKIKQVDVVTMQALSGSGYPGVPSIEILDNVIPYISDEENKVESEPKKILGSQNVGGVTYYDMNIRAHCNRVAVIDGHTECVTIELEGSPSELEIIEAWRSFSGEPQELQLPTAPSQPIVYFDERAYPQPRKHRHLGKGMTVSVGGLRQADDGAWKFVVLSHNTIRGAAGGAILNAELLVEKGYLK
jgi:aspartate-semialdehyde dehydrogenase